MSGGVRAAGRLALAAAIAGTAALPGPRAEARAEAGDPRPDRTLYREAQQALATLEAMPRRQARRSEWERVIMRFRRVVARYPQSGYCDDALLNVGHLYRRMGSRFKNRAYLDDAVEAYRTLVAEYPSSRHGEPALNAVLDIARQQGDAKAIARAAREYLDGFPDSPRAAEVRTLVRRRAPAAVAALPQPEPRGLARLFDLRHWSGESSTRVVLDLERKVEVRSDRIQDPDRIWIDLHETRMHPNLRDRTFPVGNGLLEQIRVATNRPGVVRVVLDLGDVKDHSIVYLQDPTRLVVDVRGSQPVAQREEREPYDGPPPEPAPSPPARTAAAAPPPAAEAPPARPAPPESGGKRRPALWNDPPASTPAAVAPAKPAVEAPSAAAAPAVAPAAGAPRPPQLNRAGSYSMARQLGLGARRIVIDAGHGGHDPGSIGPRGLQEKELVLDVALRLEKLVRKELGAEVRLTRANDVFVPLEERTAIANSSAADLFLSIHANSSRNHRSRGVETYFLSFAADPHAAEVAARENAISSATLKDLQDLVKAIALNSKIDESRDFAASVQEAVLSSLRAEDPHLPDRGVRTAPFYVLIGANMPSVLAEISFLSHPDDEKRLREGDHRQRIAEGLLAGVRAYLEALDRSGAVRGGRLTGLRPGSTVSSEARGK